MALSVKDSSESAITLGTDSANITTATPDGRMSSMSLTGDRHCTTITGSADNTTTTHYITHSATRRSTASAIATAKTNQRHNKLLLTKPTTTTITTTNLFTFSRPDFLKRITTTTTTAAAAAAAAVTSTSTTGSTVNNNNNINFNFNYSQETIPADNNNTDTSSSPKPASILSTNSVIPHTTIKHQHHKKESSISSLTGIGLSSIGFLVNSAANLAHSNHSSQNNHNNNNNNNNSNNMTFSNSTAKPVIRHITSSSTLASISNNNSSLLSLPKPETNYTNLLNPNSSSLHNSNTPESTNNLSGLILRPGDVWSQVILRVIPLFNGEGHKGFIEDLNDFVSQHIHKTIADSPSKSIIKLHSDITELFANGVMILNNKLQPDQLSDERLIIRVFEVWHFFFTGVLPYLEAIFLPLMSDQNLLNMIDSKNNIDLQERLQQQHLLQQATTNASLLSSTSSSILFRQSHRNNNNPTSQQPRNRLNGSSNLRTDQEVIQGIDIRRLALIAFREHLVLPLHSRLYKLFTMLYDPAALTQSSPPPTMSMPVDPQSSDHMHFKRLQMIGLLCSVQTDDSKQSMMAEFSKLIRLKKANPELLASSTVMRNIPPRTASANPNGAGPLVSNHREVTDQDSRSRDRSESSSSSRSRSSLNQQHISRQSHTITIATSNLKLYPEEYDDDRPLMTLLDDDIESQQIKGWNKNRDFARRSIRRQLGRNGTAIRRASRASDENFSSRMAVIQPLRRPETRVQKNLLHHRRTRSDSRNLEDGTPDSTSLAHHPDGSPSAVTTMIKFPNQGTGRYTVDKEDQLLEYLSDRVYPHHNAQPGNKELSHQRSRVLAGTKTGSASSTGSALSISQPQPPPTSSSTSTNVPSYHHRVNNPPGPGHHSSKEELESQSTNSSDPLPHDLQPSTGPKLANSFAQHRLNPSSHPILPTQYHPTQPLRLFHHHHHLQQQHQRQHQQPQQQPHLNLSIEPLKLSHYRSRSSSNLPKESPNHQTINLHHHPHQNQQPHRQLINPPLSSSSSSSTSPPTPQF